MIELRNHKELTLRLSFSRKYFEINSLANENRIFIQISLKFVLKDPITWTTSQHWFRWWYGNDLDKQAISNYLHWWWPSFVRHKSADVLTPWIPSYDMDSILLAHNLTQDRWYNESCSDANFVIISHYKSSHNHSHNKFGIVTTPRFQRIHKKAWCRNCSMPNSNALKMPNFSVKPINTQVHNICSCNTHKHNLRHDLNIHEPNFHPWLSVC